jgi:transposase
MSWLKRQIFGTKSERFIPNEEQLRLPIGVEEKPVIPVMETIEYNRSKTPSHKPEGHGRGSMPTHLPVVEETIMPVEDVSGLVKIGEDRSWHYEYDPGRFFIHVYIRPKFALPGEISDKILISALPPQPIEKGNAGPGLIAQVIIDKYVYHMPLDRQRQKFSRQYGVEIAESTMCDMVRQGCFWLMPLYELLKKQILSCTYLQADEVPIPVLVKAKQGQTHKGYYWVFRDPIGNRTFFEYRSSRSRDGPTEILKGFKGVLQIDGYAGYNQVIRLENLLHAACGAHVRRKFEGTLESDRERVEYALKIMGTWFEVEREAQAQTMSFEERLALRQKKTVPSMDVFYPTFLTPTRLFLEE